MVFANQVQKNRNHLESPIFWRKCAKVSTLRKTIHYNNNSSMALGWGRPVIKSKERSSQMAVGIDSG